MSYLLGDVGRRRHVEDGLKSGLVRGPLVVQAVLHRHGDGSDLIAELSVVLTNARFCSYFKGLMLDVHVQLQRRHFCSYFEGTQTILICSLVHFLTLKKTSCSSQVGAFPLDTVMFLENCKVRLCRKRTRLVASFCLRRSNRRSTRKSAGHQKVMKLQQVLLMETPCLYGE